MLLMRRREVTKVNNEITNEKNTTDYITYLIFNTWL